VKKNIEYQYLILDDEEEEEDPDYKKDPMYQIDLQVNITQMS
jgi:hypothetical protein